MRLRRATKLTSLTKCLGVGAAVAVTGCGTAAHDIGGLRSVDTRDLAIMVLPKRDLGPEAKDLDLDDESGRSDNADGADDTLDPNDTAADLRRAGRLAGYDLGYNDYFVPADGETGLAYVGTSVELFRDAASGKSYADARIRDYSRFEGKEVEEVVLRRVQHYDVDDLGEQEFGLLLDLAHGNDTARFWIVAFRVDRLVANATVLRTDDASGQAYAQRLAAALRQRVGRVAAGEIAR